MNLGRRVGGALYVLAAFLTATGPACAQGRELDEAARGFWLSTDDEVRAEAAARLLAADVGFDRWYGALRSEPRFDADVPTGRLDRMRVSPDGVPHPYTLLVPEAYDPVRAYPVLVYLHGGINRGLPRKPGGWWRDYDRIADPERIVVVPAAWNASTWWRDSQVDNLAAIIRSLGRTYHLDTDRVHLLGISDGGTGAYYQAFRAATPWASFLPFIGHPAVLSSPRLQVDGQMYVTNLRNRPLMIVNGGQDRLYPASSVEPFVRFFRAHDVEVLFRPHAEAGHDLSWLADESARIDSFIVATKRDPLPDTLDWETEDVGWGRFSWIIIDELGAVPGESVLPERNTLNLPADSEPIMAFPRRRPSGRISAERHGNRVVIRTDGVRKFRLLISPDEFDLTRPIRVEINGTARFDERVQPSLETLLEWAARDGDRSMLFVAEISLDP